MIFTRKHGVVITALSMLVASACGAHIEEQTAEGTGTSPTAPAALPAGYEGAAPSPGADADSGQTSGTVSAAPEGSSPTGAERPQGSAAVTRNSTTSPAVSSGKGQQTSARPGVATATGAGPAQSASSAGSPARPESAPAGGPRADDADQVRVPGPNSQGVSDTEIQIGALLPLSGIGGFVGEIAIDAIKAFTADINAKGGVHGRRYRVVVADTRLEPSVEAAAARRLVEEDKVFGLLSTFSDSIAPYVTKKGIPNVLFGATPYAFASKYPNVYPVGFAILPMAAQMPVTLIRDLKLPIKSVAYAYDTENIAWGPWAEFPKRAWEALGVEVKSIDRFNVSDGDCTALTIKIRNLNVDFWNVGMTTAWPLCAQAMARQNWRPKYGFGGMYTDDINFAGQAGQAADGMYSQTNTPQIFAGGAPYPWDPSNKAPAAPLFAETMRKYSPRSATPAGLEGVWAQTFWVAAKLLHEAIQHQAEAITWSGVNQWIQKQRDWRSGLLPPMSFDPKCKTGGQPGYMYQYKWDGKGLVEENWQKLGGPKGLPPDIAEAMAPGAGPCFATALADMKA